ncbi:L,D-transpeptidase family protein [Vibrio sp. A11]|uniref:L,D-transpeptidase family protein n=1 Tax=bacterium 19MO02SH05 TaxID=2920696 RepID=A0AAU6TF41_UNCXX|nr:MULTISPECIES: L,D-transpeptidase family protein [unclassified Vibrio]EKO3588915.1 L,D-transpeptidase family protein [Vibrio metschnikovii]EKO3716620.1 L,D-transpeptidase family protein [Vibrio metschnikovii]EKO3926743.1 L,D-transpeptidase family protein [Vibrio metschnikovii]NNN59303.1 L,D-transpeptidase family protein [Vibrio sp. A11]NNN84785.1 L,D-transpeptidase family protein [Vibrio sp. A8-1]
MKRYSLMAIVLLWISLPLFANTPVVQLPDLKGQSEYALHYPQQVEKLYQRNQYQLIWRDELSRVYFEQQLALIHQANISPLFSKRYKQLRALSEQQAWVQYDVLATDTIIGYLSYAQLATQQGIDWFFNGKLNYALPLPSASSRLALSVAAGTPAMADLVLQHAPQDPAYHQLVYAHGFLSALKATPLPLYRQAGLKRPGDKLDDRPTLIQRLALVNIDVTVIRDDVSWYDNSLIEPIKHFQQLHGLTADGVIGPQTLKWLNLSVEERLGLIALNAERMRLWPTSNTSIVVNVPSFELKYWHAGENVFQSKVVVGRISRPTPVMTTRLDSLIVNPTWNIPYKIMVEDILPIAKRDLRYLDRQNLEILPRWGATQTLDPTSIDWENISLEAFPYRMRQRAGYHNALGLYKFNTPNRRAIFLHDTPSKYLFERDSRAFSSGCIRVEHADQFANMLLTKQGLDSQQFAPQSSSVNQAIPLRQRIPVQIIYQTAWYDAGQLHFREDIYRLDKLVTH